MQEIKMKEVCKLCGCTQENTKEDIREMQVEDENGEPYKILYYYCLGCRKPIVVQIDDNTTLRELGKLKDLTIKAAKNNMNHESIPKPWIRKKNRLNNLIRERRKRLMERLEGKKVENKRENFSIII